MHIVFDIGGTNLRAAAVRNGRIGRVIKLPTPADPQQGLDALIEAARTAASGEPIEAAAGGVAGVIEENGAIFRSPNLPAWQGFPFRAALAEHLGCPIAVENDATLAALGEAAFGAGADRRIVAYAGIGTGLGGAKIVDKRIDPRAAGFEPGQLIVDPAAPAPAEADVAGSGLARRYGAPAETLGRDIFERETPKLAAILYDAVLLWSPDVLVLGGSLMNEKTGYRLADIVREMEKLPRVFPRLPEVRKSKLGDDAGLWGAVTLFETMRA